MRVCASVPRVTSPVSMFRTVQVATCISFAVGAHEIVVVAVSTTSTVTVHAAEIDSFAPVFLLQVLSLLVPVECDGYGGGTVLV